MICQLITKLNLNFCHKRSFFIFYKNKVFWLISDDIWLVFKAIVKSYPQNLSRLII
ncbi:hypothetical protein EJK55_0524 [Moraxella catarrhalis]|uniref:Uncharacterized protein n=1 Tax=Moraxella catarrhalis TaxID=480 RepID=A0A3Q9GCD9_MORCA|nr:hypothetical protein EJK53_2235 [Moraxella catarrhalis]AZQ95217.1 hypothetical protein EJK48_2072 [Moraxella catarrhalis]RUO12989.1 hypothetical protein EJK55_0524 [Moraxella catarrhalis]RUO14074.1 hypothetical protein EJK49_1199 [Moraxella catarrhalis]RUO16664.1 hypothetical protein EJK54_0453 [Moraxella catarrhalis]